MARTARRFGLAGAAALVLSGCAERQLVSAPSSTPPSSTWAAVWAASVASAVVLGILLTLPAWRTRAGARIAVAVLTIQTGAVALAGAVLAAVAVRSWQLIERPLDADPTGSLIRLSRVDGDTAFFALMVLLVTAGIGLVATVTALATRFAAGTDRLERAIACGVLSVELGGAAYAVVRVLLGEHGWPHVAGAVAAAPLAAAIASCWPRAAPSPT